MPDVGPHAKKNRVHIYNNMHRRRSKSKSPKTKQKRYRGSEDDPAVKQYMEHAMPLLRDWINFPLSYTHIPYSQAVAAVYAELTDFVPPRPSLAELAYAGPQLITPAQPEVLEHYAPRSHVTRGSMIKNGYMCSEHSRVSITVAGISLLMSIDGLQVTPQQMDSLVTIQYSVLPTTWRPPPPHPIEFSDLRDNLEECLKNAMEIAFLYIFTAAHV